MLACGSQQPRPACHFPLLALKLTLCCESQHPEKEVTLKVLCDGKINMFILSEPQNPEVRLIM